MDKQAQNTSILAAAKGALAFGVSRLGGPDHAKALDGLLEFRSSLIAATGDAAVVDVLFVEAFASVGEPYASILDDGEEEAA